MSGVENLSVDVVGTIGSIVMVGFALTKVFDRIIGLFLYKKSDFHFSNEDRKRLKALYESYLMNKNIMERLVLVLEKMQTHIAILEQGKRNNG